MNAKPETPLSIEDCYHCGGDLTGDNLYEVTLGGSPRYFCCAGCLAIAQTIHGQGLEAFYTRRIPLGQKPDGVGQLTDQVPDALLAYDDPVLMDRFTRASSEYLGELETTLRLEKIRCAACVWLNEQHLKRLFGVKDVQINYVTQRATVRFNPNEVHLSKLLHQPGRKPHFLVGLVWGLVPCGLIYSILPLAFLSGDGESGGLLMLAFGLGTLPNLLLISGFSARLAAWGHQTWARYMAAGLMIFTGLFGLYRALTLPDALLRGGFCIG